MPAADANAMILHQYDASPFSEKVRVVFGIKGLSWFACDQPLMLPKERMAVLTGGYRRIPALQIGADLYFDTPFIIEELERRAPEPSAFAGIGRGLGTGLSHWCDSWSSDSLFISVVGLLFGGDMDVPEVFLKDREALTGSPFDIDRFTAARPHLEFQLRGHLDLLEAQLADGRAFLTGATPNMTDASFYFHLWFMRRGKGATARILDDYPHLSAWEGRVDAIGHGERTAVSPDDAIAIAKGASPAPLTAPARRAPTDPEVGAPVRVKYHDANTPPLEGVLAGATQRHVSVRRQSPEAGEVMLHIPRSAGTISAPS